MAASFGQITPSSSGSTLPNYGVNQVNTGPASVNTRPGAAGPQVPAFGTPPSGVRPTATGANMGAIGSSTGMPAVAHSGSTYYNPSDQAPYVVPPTTAAPHASGVPGLTAPPTFSQYAASLPQVQAAWNNYTTGQNTAATTARNAYEQSAITYGAPVPGSSSTVPGLGNLSVAKMLGYNVDPATSALAAAATKAGVSTLAQLNMAAAAARNNAIGSGDQSGSSSLFTNENAVTNATNLAAFNAAQNLESTGQGIGQTYLDTVNPLRAAYQNSFGNALNYVDNHATSLPVNGSPTASTARYIAQGMSPSLARIYGSQPLQTLPAASAPSSSTMAQLVAQGMTPRLARQYAGTPWSGA